MAGLTTERKGNKKTAYLAVKRGFDVISSASLLVLLSPLMAGLAIAVKVSSPGSVFFVHTRDGINGRKFGVYKFRSMIKGSENLELSLNDEDLIEYYKEFKLKNDPRVTGVGAFLRSSSLDELPQLLNILKGEMSLVGPRPIMNKEKVNYSQDELVKLESVKPGLTGYWQAYGRYTAKYQDGSRQKMELYYADHASLTLDCKIIAKTISTGLTKLVK